MITTLKQAKLVQEKRVANNKQGYSKAVRSFLKRNLNLNKQEDYDAYLTLKKSLPNLPITTKVIAKDEAED